MKPARPAIKDWKDLGTVKRDIENRARYEAEQQALKLAATRKAQAEQQLFVRSVGQVKALPVKHRPGHKADLPATPAAPVPVQKQRDELAVMREAISDGFDAASLLDTDDALSYRCPGLGVDVVRKLRRGEWSIQRQLDLHGLRSDDARDRLSAFIREAYRAGLRCVRVVHGKGLGSPGKAPVLKTKVQNWLIQKQEVLAFVQARPTDGGAGALVVLLAQS
jgi:DNA-nicking Smr family endonuclease